MQGSSQSSLVGCSDGNFYVLKLGDNPQGSNTLFNEAFGSILAHYLDLPVPEWRPVYVPSDFIQKNPDLVFELEGGTRKPRPGLHFGSKFLICARDQEVYEAVPRPWMRRLKNPHAFAGMLLLDIWAANADRRQVLFIEHSADRTLEAVFFDQGHMFGGPNGNKMLKKPELCLYYHRDIYRTVLNPQSITVWLDAIEGLTDTALRSMMKQMPAEWRTRALENETIGMLMRNQKTLREEATKISKKLLSDENLFCSAVNKSDESSIYL